MVQRSRTHILEDLSIRYFDNIIPENWVIRDKSKDYGIDREVEIFDVEGHPTGLIFYVQLKATESKTDYNIKNVSFDDYKIEQFRSYAIPVIIVRYSHSENKAYYTWANDNSSLKLNSNKVIVKFTENRILDLITIFNIESYLIRFYRIKNGFINYPLNILIKDSEFSKIKSTRVKFYFKKIINNYSQYFKIERDINKSCLQLVVDESKIYLSLSDVYFSSFSYEFQALIEENEEYYSDILLACLSIVLFQINKNELAYNLFKDNNLIEVIKLNEQFLIHFLPHLVTYDKIEEVFKVLDFIFDIDKDNTIQNLVLTLVMIDEKIVQYKSEYVIEFIHKQLNYSIKINYAIGIGLAYYNLGNINRNLGNFKNSIDYYLLARKYNPDYKNKGYYYFEIAGLLFQLEKYRFSSIFYDKSMVIGVENKIVKALQGDSLIYQGYYEKGLTLIDEYLKESKNEMLNNDEWILKFSVFKTLLINDYPKFQERDTNKAGEFIKLKQYEQAIEYDLLSAEAWFNIGIIENNKDNINERTLAFLMASLLDSGYIESWINATISCVMSDDLLELIPNIIKTAYNYHNEVYIDKLYEYLNDNFNEVPNQLFNIIEEIILEVRKNGTMIRILDDDVGYRSIRYN
ncbi:DUF4365 domain-containing protein [Empedobacter brevis]|nr:DUF4365 domain-containing protein [Empedobacter brevis]